MPKIILAILSVFICFNMNAQSVGLVLSGGGAKGIAHIGVIKVLEENGIPIDYVAGTSIGAIIAGLYASGYSPDEMLELFSSDEFKLWSTGKLDKEDLYYFKRKDEGPAWIKLDITKKEDKLKIIFPINLIPERQMDFAFMQITAQTTAACNGDFNKLMVPFRCVSTDIYHNKAIIHKSGDVGEAIRASMTFPFVFKPIEKNGTLLFDGGIVNNFPTDIMKEEFNPDIIIGHKVTSLGEKYDTEDLFNQIESMVTQITNYNIPDSIGILLESKLDNVSLLDFPKVNYTYGRGVSTALNSIEKIKRTVTRRVSKDEVNKRREKFNGLKPPLKFNNIQVEGIKDDMQRKYIIQSFKRKENIIEVAQLRDSYFKLISDDHIKSIRPIAFYNKRTGFFDLHLKVEPRKPFDVEIGGLLSTQSNTFGFVQANYKTFKTLSYNLSANAYFGKFYNSFSIGGRMDSPSRNPFYISTRFTLNSWDYTATTSDIVFKDINPSYIIRNENSVKIEGGIPFIKTGIVDFGTSLSNSTDHYYQTNIFERGDEMDETRFSAFSAFARVDQKNYNYKQYATEGGRKLLSFRYIYGKETFTPGTTAPVPKIVEKTHSYFQIKAFYEQYFKINRLLKLGGMAEAVFNNNTLYSNYTSTVIAAPAFYPTPISRSKYIENFRANQYFALGGKAIFRISDYLHFRTELFGFAPIQNFQNTDNNLVGYEEGIFQHFYFSGMAALVFQTQLGPISAELNYFDKQGQSWFFALNLGFVLFNERAL